MSMAMPKAPVVFLVVAALVIVGVHAWMTDLGGHRISTDPPAWPGATNPYDQSKLSSLPDTLSRYQATFGEWQIGAAVFGLTVLAGVLGAVLGIRAVWRRSRSATSASSRAATFGESPSGKAEARDRSASSTTLLETRRRIDD
jgi:hypothetical protein